MINWDYIRGEVKDLASLAGWTILVLLAFVGAWHLASLAGV
jgi:hypothetical protein